MVRASSSVVSTSSSEETNTVEVITHQHNKEIPDSGAMTPVSGITATIGASVVAFGEVFFLFEKVGVFEFVNCFFF